ncbi:hypothetical protein CUU54_02525 [Pectobacterium polaris]|uniref:hypothetical protein n=1 Tax=Pectobacterium polaris TaxID=2042057 RepID=UPI000D609635|nr:hypothetical protein [Pectobacterium polaris]MCU1787732.1 hypothetical protein [Pectobacterium polaris]PWD54864.1 hypothetical protein DF209_21500 [Pectobacterium polaris]
MDTFNYVKPVMPTDFVPEDGPWIQEMLRKLPGVQRAKIAHEYARVYQENFDEEPVSFKQQNAGRKVANERLREYIDKFYLANQGFTSPPPLAPSTRVAA